MDSAERSRIEKFVDSKWFKLLGAASVFIGILTAVATVPPIQEKIFEQSPRVELELVSEIPVLDIRRPMEGLEIYLNNKNLNASRDSLVAARVIIKNKGRTGIKPNDISPSDPLGFSLKGGEILELTGFSASTSHLRKLSKPKKNYNTIIVNSEIIIDRNDFLQFDLLIKKQRGRTVSFSPIGKISDVQSIDVVDQRFDKSQESFIERSFYGSPSVQFARSLVYTLLGLIAIVGIAFLHSSVSDILNSKRQKKRKLIVEKFLLSGRNRNEICDVLVSSIYYTFGIKRLRYICDYLSEMSISSSIGKIKSDSITIFGRNLNMNFDDLNSALYDVDFRAASWIMRLESQLNLVSIDRKNVQKPYLESVEAMIAMSEAMDPKNKLKSNNDLYYAFPDDRIAARMAAASIAED